MDHATVAVRPENLSFVAPLVVVAITGILLVVLVFYGARIFTGTREVRESLRCPLRRQDVVVHTRITAWDATPVDVVRCSAFEPARAVACAKACLAQRTGRPTSVVAQV